MRFLILFIPILCACNIRAVAILETEDAIYGETEVRKVQKYDPKQRHLDVFESIVGVVNSDSIKGLSEIINGQAIPPAQQPVTPAQPVKP